MPEQGNDTIGNYMIGANKLRRAYYSGFTLSENGSLMLEEGEEHFIILKRFNSYEKGSVWGIFSMQADIEQKGMLTVRAFAKDIAQQQEREQVEEIEQFFHDKAVPIAEKRAYFERAEGITARKHKNILLYELTGQYLWISIEITGSCRGVIKEMCLRNPGDNFMKTFPEIYQEQGGFFHRYLSIFSTIYHDMNQKITQMERYLDLDTAPEWMLPYFAQWLGFEMGGKFLEEQILRNILKQAYQLNRLKGTKQVITRLTELILDKQAVIVERNRLEGHMTAQDRQIYHKLYGEDIQDITILVNMPGDEKLQAQLQFLINLFKPVRSRVKLVFYQNCNRLDSYCFLDRNAILCRTHTGMLEREDAVDGGIILL